MILMSHSGPPLAASHAPLISWSLPVALRSSLLLRFVVSPLSLVKGKHSKPSEETP